MDAWSSPKNARSEIRPGAICEPKRIVIQHVSTVITAESLAKVEIDGADGGTLMRNADLALYRFAIEDLYRLQSGLRELMWRDVGLSRDALPQAARSSGYLWQPC